MSWGVSGSGRPAGGRPSSRAEPCAARGGRHPCMRAAHDAPRPAPHTHSVQVSALACPVCPLPARGAARSHAAALSRTSPALWHGRRRADTASSLLCWVLMLGSLMKRWRALEGDQPCLPALSVESAGWEGARTCRRTAALPSRRQRRRCLRRGRREGQRPAITALRLPSQPAGPHVGPAPHPQWYSGKRARAPWTSGS